MGAGGKCSLFSDTAGGDHIVGAAIGTYHLVCFKNTTAGCLHHALVRVTRPEFGNWNANAERAAEAAADHKRNLIIDRYRTGRLAQHCARDHSYTIEGEYHGFPEGEIFYASHGQVMVEVWVAARRLHPYWIVFGMAASEEDFWHCIAADDELQGVELRRPARLISAFFITEADYPIE
jgi:hypothetical protein